MDNIGARIPWDPYDHFRSYVSFSVRSFQKLAPVTFFFLEGYP